MRITITEGYLLRGDYRELSRFDVEVDSPDASVEELLARVRARPWTGPLAKKRDAFFLAQPGHNTPLVEARSLASYGIKDGSVLRLFCADR